LATIPSHICGQAACFVFDSGLSISLVGRVSICDTSHPATYWRLLPSSSYLRNIKRHFVCPPGCSTSKHFSTTVSLDLSLQRTTMQRSQHHLQPNRANETYHRCCRLGTRASRTWNDWPPLELFCDHFSGHLDCYTSTPAWAQRKQELNILATSRICRNLLSSTGSGYHERDR
jgi:hypothetical protein